MDILLDDYVLTNLSGGYTSTDKWFWIYTKIVFPDTVGHILGIRIKSKGLAIDKLYFYDDSISPIMKMSAVTEIDLKGPNYSDPTYITFHMKLYESQKDENYPAYPLFIYDYKTTLDQIIEDDWYNFNIKVLDDRMGYDKVTYFDEKYYLVVTATGSTTSNFVLWELIDNDEYNSLFSSRIFIRE
jgi:hypothetical protein